MPLIIRTVSSAQDAYTSQRTRLDGRDYLLRFSFNEREERWYLSLFDEDELPILEGLKLVCSQPLLQAYRSNPDVPRGELVVMDLTDDNSPPTLDELGEGKRCELLYITAEELEALKSRNG